MGLADCRRLAWGVPSRVSAKLVPLYTHGLLGGDEHTSSLHQEAT